MTDGNTIWVQFEWGTAEENIDALMDVLSEHWDGKAIIVPESIDVMDEAERREYVKQLTESLENDKE